MKAGDELVVTNEALPEQAVPDTLFHLTVSGEADMRLRCALLVRETGPMEALCEVLGIMTRQEGQRM